MEEYGISKRNGDGSCPFGGAFRPYTPTISRTAAAADGSLPISSSSGVNLRRPVSFPLVSRLTKDIVKTFQLCNPNFKYSEAPNPKRFLTDPSAGVSNNGYDNANSDLILHVNSVLINSSTSQRYIVKEMLGQGTFGQVAKCWVSESNSYVAVKVIKSHTAYYRQALVEVSILTMLNQMLGLDEKCHIVRVLDHFVYQRHLCISFEMLGSNLYELIRMMKYTGFPLSIVQVFSKQILHALVVIKDAGIIHCDLKPENILLSTSEKPEIKVIDFGSACMEGHTVYTYIQSRYYRSPEVLLGYPYTAAIDMWSFGCIVAELFLGFPLFGGASEYDLLKRMIKILGGQPPDDILRNAKGTDKFFKHVASVFHSENDQGNQKMTSIYRMLTEEEYEVRLSTKPIIGKHYFSQLKLEDIIAIYPYRKGLSEQEVSKESITRLALVDFLRGLVEFDPRKRWSPLQASRHPFVTGEPFLCPYKPPPETPRIHVINPITVDHNPGVGHWLAAGLSPQITNANRCFLHNNPHFYMVPLSQHSSFGSLGSHCSYNDNTLPGSGYGSYGDINSVYSYFSPVGPCGQNIQTQVGGQYLGASSDAWHRPHMSHGNGFGASPNGSLGPMSLGASPSQFTPPGSLVQISTVSPGKYGATSPARGRVHGSPFGKAAAIGQYNKSSWGYPGTSIQTHESASQQFQGHHGDVISCHSDALAQGHLVSPPTTLLTSNLSNWRRQMGPSSSNHAFPVSGSFNTNAVSSHSVEISRDKPEIYPSLPDPADWDPTCSGVFLLEEDNSEVSSLASAITSNVCLGKASDAFLPSEAGKSVHNHNQACTNSKFVSSSQRIEGLFPPYSHAESGSHIAQDVVSAYSLPHFPQNPPSRFGQQPVHGYNQHSTLHVERIHSKGQPARSNYPVADSYSAANTMLGSGMSWGRRDGHPIGTTLPSCHAGKD